MITNMKNHSASQDIELKLKASLREKGYKLTQQRLEIIKLLSHDRSHPGAMDILSQLKKTAPKISLSTVYYTLDIMKREGLIQELEFYDRDNRYDINVSNHINLICRKCGKIEDFVAPLPFSSEMIEGKTGFRPVGMRFEYYGYCNGCSRGKKKR
jgi:Fur family transcriptional regulator, peroxide stress response regulator